MPASSIPPFVASHGDKDREKAMVPREHRKRERLHEGDWRQVEHTAQAERLIRDATENDAIKDAWIKVIQAENHLARDSTAFLPRVQLKETNHTFKLQGNWDSLSFQEKANLIIADKAVKLMELQCRGSVTRHQERENITNNGSGLPDKKPNILGREPNTD